MNLLVKHEKPLVFLLTLFWFLFHQIIRCTQFGFFVLHGIDVGECISHYMIMSFHPLKYEDHFSLRMKDIFQAKWKNTVSSESIKSK